MNQELFGKNAELLGITGFGKLSVNGTPLDADLSDFLAGEADLTGISQKDLSKVKFTPAPAGQTPRVPT